MRQFSIKLSEYLARRQGLAYLPIIHDVVCDFPLPCSPHINTEKGMFVFRKSLGSAILVEYIPSSGRELPSSPYCGRKLRSKCSNKSAGKRTAFLISSCHLSRLSVSSARSSSLNWLPRTDKGSPALLLGK